MDKWTTGAAVNLRRHERLANRLYVQENGKKEERVFVSSDGKPIHYARRRCRSLGVK